jgi:hypothetical protein
VPGNVGAAPPGAVPARRSRPRVDGCNPVSDLALSHGVGVTEEATTGEVAYAGSPETVPGPYPEGLLSDG